MTRGGDARRSCSSGKGLEEFSSLFDDEPFHACGILEEQGVVCIVGPGVFTHEQQVIAQSFYAIVAALLQFVFDVCQVDGVCDDLVIFRELMLGRQLHKGLDDRAAIVFHGLE